MLEDQELSFVRSRLDFYPKLADSDARALDAAVAKYSYPKGSRLRSRDSECLGVLLVREGDLRVSMVSDEGREITLYRIGPGELCVLSASCILNSLTFDVSISADRDSVAYRVGLGVFERLMRENVYVENFAYRSAIERFSDVMWAVEQLLFTPVGKRLAAFLLDESARTGGIDATHDRIAGHIGSAREVVSRLLKGFQSQGLVESSRGAIRVIDREKLKALL